MSTSLSITFPVTSQYHTSSSSSLTFASASLAALYLVALARSSLALVDAIEIEIVVPDFSEGRSGLPDLTHSKFLKSRARSV